MNEWKYIDEYEHLPDCQFINCDTRDFHIICSPKVSDEIKRNIEKTNGYGNKSDCLFTRDEILKVLKDLETKSGGKGEWRKFFIGNINWLKYIWFIKWDKDKYLASTRDCKILSRKLLEESPINEEHLNFIKKLK